MAAKKGKKPATHFPPHKPHHPGHPRGPALFRGLAKAAVTLAVVGAVFALVVWAGVNSGERVAPRDRYAVKFADIACDVPPGTDKQRFLTEVRYLGDWPETFQVVDPDLKPRLASLFARHPWVAKVNPVTVEADATVRVPLEFRIPVLAVTVTGEPEPRAVDKGGVILPSIPNLSVLPLFATPQPPPTQKPGEVWASDAVRRAADLASTYQPPPRRLEATSKGWKLTKANGEAVTIGW